MLDKESYKYSELVGGLLYLSVCPRPEISQAMGVLSRHMANPSMEHWTAAKGVLRYIAGTPQTGILYGGGSQAMEGYCVLVLELNKVVVAKPLHNSPP